VPTEATRTSRRNQRSRSLGFESLLMCCPFGKPPFGLWGVLTYFRKSEGFYELCEVKPRTANGTICKSPFGLRLAKRDLLGGSPHAPCGMPKMPNICRKMAPGRARQGKMCGEYSGHHDRETGRGAEASAPLG
jgi:hypothetical protein